MKIFFISLWLGVYVSFSLQAADCLWNEKGLEAIFPKATSYLKVIKEINPENKQNLKNKLGEESFVNELTTWTFYEIKKEDQLEGFLFADQEFTDDGLVEIVIAVNTEKVIQNIIVQRATDSEMKYLIKLFLNQFIGKSAADVLQIGTDIQLNSLDYLISKNLTQGIREQLIVFEELTKK